MFTHFTHQVLLEIAKRILLEYRLSPDGIHGVSHWGRVLETGMRLAKNSGANVRVLQLFALFHDSRRMNDGSDPDHGMRGAALAGEMQGSLFTLPSNELYLLQDACSRHTLGQVKADITIQTCWDADRLDLLRIGIFPIPELLCTDAARDPALISWANERSRPGYVTNFAQSLLCK